MSGWDGNGSFVRVYSWVADKNAGINITASRMDADTNNITNNGFGNTLTRDGQGSATNNLPMNNFLHTGVGNATAIDQYAVTGQVQVSSYNSSNASGSGDAVTANFLPAITTLTNKMVLFVRAAGTNTLTAPTFSPNSLTAHTITKFGGKPLQAGDIVAANVLILYYNLENTRWELLNPTYGSNAGVPWAVAGGAADVITATYAPVNGSLTDGLLLSFRASAANATTTPTFSPDSLTAHTITKEGGVALVAGDIPAALGECLVRYNLANTRWELLNPAPSAAATVLFNSQLVTTNTTFTIPATAIASTRFKFRLVGGGGGGGGAGTTNGAAGGGGGSGDYIEVVYYGFTAGQNVTIVCGSAGSGGAAGANPGAVGSATTLAYNAVTIATATNGQGGAASAGLVTATGGGKTTSSASAGASGLTLATSTIAGSGGSGTCGGTGLGISATVAFSGVGGSNPIGYGGISWDSAHDGLPGTGYGAGGAGGVRMGGTDAAGGNGKAGAVFIEWWLP